MLVCTLSLPAAHAASPSTPPAGSFPPGNKTVRHHDHGHKGQSHRGPTGATAKRPYLIFNVCNGLTNQLEGVKTALYLAREAGMGIVLPTLMSRSNWAIPNFGRQSNGNAINLYFRDFFDEKSLIAELKPIFDGYVLPSHYKDVARLSSRGMWVDNIANLKDSPELAVQKLKELLANNLTTNSNGTAAVTVGNCIVGHTQLDTNPGHWPNSKDLTRILYTKMKIAPPLAKLVSKVYHFISSYEPNFVAVQFRYEKDWFKAHCQHRDVKFQRCCLPAAKYAAVIKENWVDISSAGSKKVVYAVGGHMDKYVQDPFAARGFKVIIKPDLFTSGNIPVLKSNQSSVASHFTLEQLGLVDLTLAMMAKSWVGNTCSSLNRQVIHSLRAQEFLNTSRAHGDYSLAWGVPEGFKIFSDQNLVKSTCKKDAEIRECAIVLNRTTFHPTCEDTFIVDACATS